MKLSFEDWFAQHARGTAYATSVERGDGFYAESLRQAWDAALAQQAQPLTDERPFIIGDEDRQRLFGTLAHVAYNHTPDEVLGAVVDTVEGIVEREIARRARDRMAQQAQPRCEQCEFPECKAHSGDCETCGCYGVAAPQPEPEDALADELQSARISLAERMTPWANPTLAVMDRAIAALRAVSQPTKNETWLLGYAAGRLSVVSQPTREQIARAIHDAIQREAPDDFVGPCYDTADAVIALYGKSEAKP